jgi:hypothetical protein
MNNKFLIKRRNKFVTKELPLIFGISGVARCGKDTLAKHLISKLSKSGFPCMSLSFASALKTDLDDFTKEKFGISAFTEDTKEKEIIRPLLVCYGTDVCRKLDPEYWIKKVEKRVKTSNNNKIIVVIPDVRYENEARWIQQNGGFVIHLKRMGQKPANFQEKVNDPIVKKIADYKIQWKTFTDEKETCFYHINKLFYTKGWSTYGEFK